MYEWLLPGLDVCNRICVFSANSFYPELRADDFSSRDYEPAMCGVLVPTKKILVKRVSRAKENRRNRRDVTPRSRSRSEGKKGTFTSTFFNRSKWRAKRLEILFVTAVM